MPRVSRKRKIDPNGVYQAWQSAALHDPNISVSAGQRLSGSHPAVQNNPWLFAPDGTLDEDVPAELGLTEKEPAWQPPPHDLRLQREPEPVDVVVLTKRVRVLVGTDAGTGRPTELVTFHEGTAFRSTAELVERKPGWFKPLADVKPPDSRRV
jgi:hypothetical protein